MTTKERVAQLVDELSEEQAADALVLLQRLLADSEQPSLIINQSERPEERETIGHVLTPDSPFWGIVGMIDDGPTDMAENHDKYLAEAYADLHGE